MARKNKRRRKKNRGVILVVEIIVLVLLAGVLFGAIWFTRMTSLVNYKDTGDIKTSSEENAQYNTDIATGQTEADNLSGYEVIALVGLDSRAEDVNTDDYSKNSDTMMICVINHNNDTIKLCSIYRDTFLNVGEDYYGEPDYYTKANAAYNLGDAEQFLSMVNLNLDLNITRYITVDFSALAEVVDLLGGIDINMTREEVTHVNNYNKETSEQVGVEYEALEIPDDPDFDGSVVMPFHCNGTQAVSYARIRYTEGNDFRRASRQREVLSLIKQKAQTADVGQLNSILEAVLPKVTTNIDSMSLISLALNIISYDMSEENMSAFPAVHCTDDGTYTGLDCVVPVTLEYNVELLHQFLFPDEEYTPSYTVQEYSDYISSYTSLTSDYIDYYASIDDKAALEGVTKEEYQQWLQTQ